MEFEILRAILKTMNMNSFYARRVVNLTFVTFFSSFLFGQTTEERTEITKDYNQEELSRLEQDLKEKSDESKKRALQLASINGWPLTFTTSKGSFAELQGVDENDNPLYYVQYCFARISSVFRHVDLDINKDLNIS